MNDTDTYDDWHRVDYHPQTDPVIGRSPGPYPGGNGLETPVETRGET